MKQFIKAYPRDYNDKGYLPDWHSSNINIDFIINIFNETRVIRDLSNGKEVEKEEYVATIQYGKTTVQVLISLGDYKMLLEREI